jgi:hypothetical protein
MALEPSQVKKRAIVLASTAEMHLQHGNLEQGMDLAGKALMAALEMESTWGVEGLRRLRPLLTQWKDNSEVRRLDDRLASVCG